MKIRILQGLLLISLAVNVVLALRTSRRPRELSRGTDHTNVIPAPAQSVAATAGGTPTQRAPHAEAPKPFHWQSLENSDYKQYAANLRAVGCPEETIRDIIRADVTKLYEEKKRQVRRDSPKWEYWKDDQQQLIRGIGREAWTGMLALDEERDSVLRTLGIEPDQRKKQIKEDNIFEWTLEFLDDAKKNQILRLRNELNDKLAARAPGSLDVQGIEMLVKQKEDSIHALLTPEEALQYDLRLSSTASTTRQQLQGFEPTEAEFVSLFKLRKAFDDEYGPKPGNEAAVDPARRQQAEKELKEQIKQTLGEQRYSEYELVQNPGFQSIRVAAGQAGASAAEVRQIYMLKQAAEEQAARIRSDQNFAGARGDAALNTIRLETEQSVQSLLGASRWEKFNQRNHTQWINRLGPRPAPANPVPPPR